jgi:hypothetical protein
MYLSTINSSEITAVSERNKLITILNWSTTMQELGLLGNRKSGTKPLGYYFLQ